MPKVKVDGVEIEVRPGATVLQACELAGKAIRRFCYPERPAQADTGRGGMNRAFGMRLLATTLALSSPAYAAPAQPASGETAQSEKLAKCAIEKHPNAVRWLMALAAKEVSLEPEVLGGAALNALAEMATGCLEGQAQSEMRGFVAAVRRMAGSASTSPARAGPMDALGDCLVRSAPQEAMAFVRESDIGALRTQRGGFIADAALQTMLEKSRGCGPIVDRLGDRVDGNQLYSRINWLLRAGPKLGAAK
jgi:2Fe-2S iron-sulfur cluster binding domain